MPLSCDCYPGCWCDHSKDWPFVPFDGTPLDARDTQVAVQAVVPYGSYVEVKDGIRIEPAYADKFPDKLRDFLKIRDAHDASVAEAAREESRNITAYEDTMAEHKAMIAEQRRAQHDLLVYARRQCEATESIARSIRSLLHKDKKRHDNGRVPTPTKTL